MRGREGHGDQDRIGEQRELRGRLRLEGQAVIVQRLLVTSGKRVVPRAMETHKMYR